MSEHYTRIEELMTDTTAQLKHDIEGIYSEVCSPEDGVGVLVFGSPMRAEMLPNSDVDFIVVTDGSAENDAKRADIIEKTRRLPYDKIDIPSQYKTYEQLEALAPVASPEASAADCGFLVGSRAMRQAFMDSDITSVFSDRDFLSSRAVYEHYAFDYRSGQKISPIGVNIKYSQGGARDILLLDQYHDLFYGHNKDVSGNTRPQINSFIDTLRESDEQQADDLSTAVVTLMLTKHLTMELNNRQPYEGKGYLSIDTAQRFIHEFPDELRAVDVTEPGELVDAFDESRRTVMDVRNRFYGRTIDFIAERRRGDFKELHNAVMLCSTPEDFSKVEPHVREVHDPVLRTVYMWRHHARMAAHAPDQQIVSQMIQAGDWFSVASTASHPAINGEELLGLAEGFCEKPGYEFLNRILIKHPNFTKQLGAYMMSIEYLAIDEDMNTRYKGELERRYEQITRY